MPRTLPLKAYKYCIYPTNAQVVFFAKTFECCRLVWNKMLDEKQQAYEKKSAFHDPHMPSTKKNTRSSKK